MRLQLRSCPILLLQEQQEQQWDGQSDRRFQTENGDCLPKLNAIRLYNISKDIKSTDAFKNCFEYSAPLYLIFKGVTNFQNLLAIWRHYSGQIMDGNVSNSEVNHNMNFVQFH